ncbi:MAG: ABC transporter ATP-binding protein [Clostridiales bacterium]
MRDSKLKSVILFLKGHIGPYKGRYITSIIFAIISVAAGVAPYWLIGELIKGFTAGKREMAYYAALLIAMAASWAVHSLCHAISTTLSHKTAFQLIADVRKELAGKLTRLPLGYMLNQPSGGVKSTFVEKASAMEPPIAHLVPEGTSAILLPLLIMGYMFALDWRMALLCLLLLPTAYVFAMNAYRKTASRFSLYIKKNKELNDVAVEYIHGIKVIKVFRQTSSQYARFRQAAREAAQSAIQWMRETAVPFGFFSSIMPAALLTLLPGGLYFMRQGTLSLENFLLIVILAMGIRIPLTRIGNLGEVYSQMALNMESIVSLLQAPELERPDQLSRPIANYRIEYSHVSFSYALAGEKGAETRAKEEALQDVCFVIEEGEKVALVGPSGSGKSTIARLLASFWDVSGGQITIGGVDVKDIPLERLNKMIAYVTQDTYLFAGTVRDNIRMGNPAATDQQVEAAARESGCEEFILNLEQGYDTPVGGAGAHLSGGEKQRIALARTMLKDSPIVILDEATAYMDPENEAVLGKAISKLLKDKTVIVIAHRLSTIIHCNPILLIYKGQLESCGKHEVLLTKSPLYASMWQAHLHSRRMEQTV